MERIDFRSDTVTWPTPEMRRAMAGARVGDDVYGEDPTVNELESVAAGRVGKAAGLFVASGTMGNLTAVLAHAQRGEETIVGDDSHTILWEAGSMAALGGVVPHTLPTDEQGRMDLTDVERAVRDDDPHLPRSRLIVLENSYGARAGYPIGPDYFSGIRAIADRHGLSVHLDGARLFNAATARGLEAARLARDVDSVTFCLSKGLCAPVGSVLCGSHDFVARARRMRKALGGGMRQAGVIAAAGLVALEEMTGRLEEDHAHARKLAEGLAGISAIRIETDRIRTNIVTFEIDTESRVDADDLVRRLRDEHEIWLGKQSPTCLRAVTHRWVGEVEVESLIDATARILG